MPFIKFYFISSLEINRKRFHSTSGEIQIKSVINYYFLRLNSTENYNKREQLDPTKMYSFDKKRSSRTL